MTREAEERKSLGHLRRTLTPIQKSQLLREYAAGMNMTALMERFGCSRELVRKVVREGAGV